MFFPHHWGKPTDTHQLYRLLIGQVFLLSWSLMEVPTVLWTPGGPGDEGQENQAWSWGGGSWESDHR